MLGWDHLLLREDQDASSHFDQDNLHKSRGLQAVIKMRLWSSAFLYACAKQSFTQPVKALAVFLLIVVQYTLDIIVHSAIINSAKTYIKEGG